jgi:hypothetical protein
MPARRGVDAVQPLAAAPTPPGLDRHERVDLFLRQEQALMAFMPGLPARLPARRHPLRGAAHGRRIRGGRARRVLRILPQARLEIHDPRPQRDDLDLLLGDLGLCSAMMCSSCAMTPSASSNVRGRRLVGRLPMPTTFSTVRTPERLQPGNNYRLTDFQCAPGRSQLEKLEKFWLARDGLARRYRERLAGSPFLELPELPAGRRHAWHLFVVLLRLERLRADQDMILEALRAENIGAQLHYSLVYRHPYYRDRFGNRPGLCPVAEDVERRLNVSAAVRGR